jgi:hypothetical protein
LVSHSKVITQIKNLLTIKNFTYRTLFLTRNFHLIQELGHDRTNKVLRRLFRLTNDIGENYTLKSFSICTHHLILLRCLNAG